MFRDAIVVGWEGVLPNIEDPPDGAGLLLLLPNIDAPLDGGGLLLLLLLLLLPNIDPPPDELNTDCVSSFRLSSARAAYLSTPELAGKKTDE